MNTQRIARRKREETPLSVRLDVDVSYSLYVRPGPRRGSPARVIVKVAWEVEEHGTSVPRACAFELDLKRERMQLLGRRNAALPNIAASPRWFCDWARAALAETAD